MTSLAIGSQITAESPVGVVRVLAQVTAPGIATCTYRITDERVCSCPIQRNSGGDLAGGVRAHYKTVHPEKGIL